MKKSGKLDRIYPKFAEDMRNVSLERVKKGFANPLDKKETSIREMTELMTRTNAYKKLLEELKTKPKKKNLI